jgi:hypothetical protein
MDNETLVERKLSGVITSVSVEIPYDAFDHFAEVLLMHCNHYGANLTKAEIVMTPGVFIAFEAHIKKVLNIIPWSDWPTRNIDADMIVNTLFPKEIQEGMERLIEVKERRRIQLQEEILVMEAQREHERAKAAEAKAKQRIDEQTRMIEEAKERQLHEEAVRELAATQYKDSSVWQKIIKFLNKVAK